MFGGEDESSRLPKEVQRMVRQRVGRNGRWGAR